MQFFTIGVYNSSEDEFFTKLTDNKIDTFCDIRQRRGVRGSQYAFVNSNRLQKKLSQLGIKYFHVMDLATPPEIRELQKQADYEKGEAYRKRNKLDESFIKEFKKKVLDKFDFDNFIKDLKNAESNRIVLFCVEQHPEACHRSIVADKIRETYNYKVTHL